MLVSAMFPVVWQQCCPNETQTPLVGTREGKHKTLNVIGPMPVHGDDQSRLRLDERSIVDQTLLALFGMGRGVDGYQIASSAFGSH